MSKLLPIVATRAIRVSPFSDDAAVYFGGYDANKVPAHNTGWTVRGAMAAIIDSPSSRSFTR